MDKISKDRRSANMRKIKSKNTKPEIIVRKLLFKEGYRYRLHNNKLPGKPDLSFKNRKKVIFINGCFWHSHDDPNCRHYHKPKSNTGYWSSKLERTIERDNENQQKIIKMGYKYLVIWECELDSLEKVLQKAKIFLDE